MKTWHVQKPPMHLASRHEEEALKIVDAQDKIARLRRKDDHRRELIKAHMEQQEERVRLARGSWDVYFHCLCTNIIAALPSPTPCLLSMLTRNNWPFEHF